MHFTVVSQIFLTSIMLGGVQATWDFDSKHCTTEQAAMIVEAIANIEPVVNAINANDFTKDNEWYKTFFGNTRPAQQGFPMIKQRYAMMLKILNGNTDKVTFRCADMKNDEKDKKECRTGVSAYVPNDEVPTPRDNWVTICTQFYNEVFNRPAMISKRADCDNMSGTKASWKSREQVLIHELSHVGVMATSEGRGQWEKDDRIIDCVMGVFLNSKVQQYTRGFQVAAANADSYAFTAMYNYFTKECPAKLPKLIPFSNIDPPTKAAGARCYIGRRRRGMPGLPALTAYSQQVRGGFANEINQSGSESGTDDENLLG